MVAYPDDNWARFTRVIQHSRGVIEGVGRHCGHAVAYEHGRIFDPDGHEYDYSPRSLPASRLLHPAPLAH